MNNDSGTNDKIINLVDVDDEIGEVRLKFRPRAKTEITLVIPVDVLASLQRVAEEKDMSVEALMRQYIGQGLREDISELFGARVLASVGRVLASHVDSPDEVETILEELREAAGGGSTWQSWAKDS